MCRTLLLKPAAKIIARPNCRLLIRLTIALLSIINWPLIGEAGYTTGIRMRCTRDNIISGTIAGNGARVNEPSRRWVGHVGAVVSIETAGTGLQRGGNI